MVPILRVTDIKEMTPAQAGEEVFQADLRNYDTVKQLMQDVDAVIHLAAIPDEADFHSILDTNMMPTYNIFEAARRCGVKRVLFASSIHAVGLYPNDEIMDTKKPVRPDTFYGVSKTFGESLGIMYADKFDLEVVSVRICSFEERPRDRRHLSTWLSPKDAVQLFSCCLNADNVTFTVVYGISGNTRRWFDNSTAEAMGYRPLDNAETYAEDILQSTPDRDLTNRADTRLGGKFALPAYTADKNDRK
jgi:uronate dehydrogenase